MMFFEMGLLYRIISDSDSNFNLVVVHGFMYLQKLLWPLIRIPELQEK